ncbi:hypothetical protein HJFPF1_12303 [Paramyrothecium foliicola]|nr:hypothetical protein HJFPF1_12303 [Paramyrothecium foliicola]
MEPPQSDPVVAPNDDLASPNVLDMMDFDVNQSIMSFDEQYNDDDLDVRLFETSQTSSTTALPGNASSPANASPSGEHTHLYGEAEAAFDGWSSPLSVVSSSSRSNCLCSEMLDVYEAVEVRIGWARHIDSFKTSLANASNPGTPPPVPFKDQYVCQRTALNCFEKWLNQDAPHIQSKHVVLMVSIADRLLTSIFSTARLLEAWSDGEDEGLPRIPLFEPSHCGRRHKQPPHNILTSGVRPNHNFQMEEGDMSDEERVHIQKSLLHFRVSRVKIILERLDAISVSNRWQVQVEMVQHLSERLLKGHNPL